jgi:hypothetical protein
MDSGGVRREREAERQSTNAEKTSSGQWHRSAAQRERLIMTEASELEKAKRIIPHEH